MPMPPRPTRKLPPNRKLTTNISGRPKEKPPPKPLQLRLRVRTYTGGDPIADVHLLGTDGKNPEAEYCLLHGCVSLEKAESLIAVFTTAGVPLVRETSPLPGKWWP